MGKHKPLIVFLITAVTLYMAWYFIYELWLHPIEYLDLPVIKNSMFLSRKLLELMGYTIEIVGTRQIYIENTSGLWIGDPCNGMNLFALFSGFIIAYPGKLLRKLIYIPLGILCIHILNVFRITGLLLLQLYAPDYLQFNHTYTFTIIIYGFIFLLWMLWVNTFHGRGNHVPANE